MVSRPDCHYSVAWTGRVHSEYSRSRVGRDSPCSSSLSVEVSDTYCRDIKVVIKVCHVHGIYKYTEVKCTRKSTLTKHEQRRSKVIEWREKKIKIKTTGEGQQEIGTTFFYTS